MDWIRRNWPDLLIGVALIAVIAGIIATLLSGGSFLPTGQRATNNPPVQSNTAPQTPVTPDPVAPTTTSPTTTTTPATDTPVATIPETPTPGTTTPDTTTPANTTETTTTTPTSTDTTPPVVAVLPGDNTDTATTTPVVPDTTTTPATDTTATTATPVSGDPFRVSVGAFKNKENADRRADTFNAAGYPVFVATQEDLYLVLVGPYASRSEAEQVQARIKNSGLEENPTIFELDTADTTSNAVATTSTTTPATTTSTSTSSTGRYIQVGAYATVESSVPQQQRLEGLGYTTEQVQEGSLIKLLIGPFSPNELGTVQDRLNSLGIDHFVR